MEAVPDAKHTQTQGGIDAFDRLAIMVFARQSWMIGFFKAMQGRYILEVFKIPLLNWPFIGLRSFVWFLRFR